MITKLIKRLLRKINFKNNFYIYTVEERCNREKEKEKMVYLIGREEIHSKVEGVSVREGK